MCPVWMENALKKSKCHQTLLGRNRTHVQIIEDRRQNKWSSSRNTTISENWRSTACRLPVTLTPRWIEVIWGSGTKNRSKVKGTRKWPEEKDVAGEEEQLHQLGRDDGRALPFGWVRVLHSHCYSGYKSLQVCYSDRGGVQTASDPSLLGKHLNMHFSADKAKWSLLGYLGGVCIWVWVPALPFSSFPESTPGPFSENFGFDAAWRQEMFSCSTIFHCK